MRLVIECGQHLLVGQQSFHVLKVPRTGRVVKRLGRRELTESDSSGPRDRRSAAP